MNLVSTNHMQMMVLYSLQIFECASGKTKQMKLFIIYLYVICMTYCICFNMFVFYFHKSVQKYFSNWKKKSTAKQLQTFCNMTLFLAFICLVVFRHNSSLAYQHFCQLHVFCLLSINLIKAKTAQKQTKGMVYEGRKGDVTWNMLRTLNGSGSNCSSF